MKITILWEDQRNAANAFGAHELLVSCVADELVTLVDRSKVSQLVASSPRKGVGKVFNAIDKDLTRLAKSGPVCAVLDHDKVREHLPKGASPSACRRDLCDAVRKHHSGDYAIVLLQTNLETLYFAAAKALGEDVGQAKPTLDARDSVLNRAAFRNDPELLMKIRQDDTLGGSFDRLVRWVCKELASASKAR